MKVLETVRYRRSFIAFGLIFAVDAFSQPNFNAIVSAAEAPFRSANDLMGSGPLFQAGFNVDYKTKYLTPYNDLMIGWYNSAYTVEEYAGIQAGREISIFKPSLTVGIGLESVQKRDYYVLDSDIYRMKREMRFPIGIGLRIDLWRKVYGEWEHRDGGFQWWKMKFGYRIL